MDYTLFYLRREREERAAGLGQRAALEAAAATSGRSVLISGATVMIAMAGMLFSGDQTFVSFSIGTMIVVAVAMLGSLTVLPALLSKLGDRVEKGRIPLLGRLRRPVGEGRIWSKVLTPVLRHPAISASLAAVSLVALAIPTAPPAHRAVRCAVAAAQRPHGRDAGPPPGSVPRQVKPRRDRRQGRRQHELDRVQARSSTRSSKPRQPAPKGTARSALTPTPRTRSRGSRSRCRAAVPMARRTRPC